LIASKGTITVIGSRSIFEINRLGILGDSYMRLHMRAVRLLTIFSVIALDSILAHYITPEDAGSRSAIK
jgi:hypothetical protein